MTASKNRAGARKVWDGVLPMEDALSEPVSQGVLDDGIRERSRLTDFEPVSCAGPPASEAIREDREDRF